MTLAKYNGRLFAVLVPGDKHQRLVTGLARYRRDVSLEKVIHHLLRILSGWLRGFALDPFLSCTCFELYATSQK